MKFKPGDEVRVIVDGDHSEIRIVKEFVPDLCGDGCCNVYTLEGDPKLYYWESQLQSVEEGCEK